MNNIRKAYDAMMADQALEPNVSSAMRVWYAIQDDFTMDQIITYDFWLGSLSSQDFETITVGDQGDWGDILQTAPDGAHTFLDTIFMTTVN